MWCSCLPLAGSAEQSLELQRSSVEGGQDQEAKLLFLGQKDAIWGTLRKQKENNL